MNFRSARGLSTLLRKHFVYFTINISHAKSELAAPGRKNTVISQSKSFSDFSGQPQKCWQCDYPHKSELFCSKCKALQKLPKDLNYFDIIGVEKDFDLVIEDVQKKYRQLQTLLHPDRFGQKSDKEKDISETLSSLVNKAYNTLLHPLDRGLYMLQLHNISIPEGTTSLEPELLMEIMDKNEQIEDALDNEEKILSLQKENREILATLTKQISNAFRNNDFDQAKVLLIRMKYYINIDTRLKKVKQELGIVD